MQHTLVSAIYAILISFAVNVVLCPILIPYLTKLKFGQYVRDDGPQSHLKKAGTPTMGGIIIVLSFVAASAFFLMGNEEGAVLVAVSVCYGFIGFVDDYIKVVKKRSLGLRAYQKMIMLLAVTAAFGAYLYFRPTHYLGDATGTAVYIPFAGGYMLNLGLWFWPFLLIVMLGTVNSVNFTDGLDGLCSGVTALVVTFFVVVAAALQSPTIPITGAAVGSLLGFLIFNSHPARVFMGDTGSFALGGFVAALAIMLKLPIVLVVIGLVYVIETLSVIIQVGYFKLTGGKRFFKMAPIHHSLELSGWSETKVVTLFYIATALLCLIGFLGMQSVFGLSLL